MKRKGDGAAKHRSVLFELWAFEEGLQWLQFSGQDLLEIWCHAWPIDQVQQKLKLMSFFGLDGFSFSLDGFFSWNQNLFWYPNLFSFYH